jgi:predicted PurR-regulated permease PerM
MEKRALRFPLWAKIATVAIVITLLLLLLRAMGGLLNPFLWALVTAYLLNPLVRALAQRSRIRRFWWVLLIYIIFGLLLFAGINYLWPRLFGQFTELQGALPDFARTSTRWLDRYGSFNFGGLVVDLRPAEADVIQWFTDLASELSASVPELVLGVIERLILLLVYLVVTFYLLLQADQMAEGFYGLIPAPYRDEIRELGRSIDRVLGAYIRSQLLLIVLMAVLTYIPLSLLGVKYALVLSIATGFLEIIPFVGPYTAAGSAVLVSLLQTTTPFGWPNWVLALVVGLIYLALRQTEDHLIIPTLVGHIVKLHPVLVIFSILAGGHLGGALGLLIAVPLAATVRIILVYLYAKLVDSPTPVAEIRADEQELLDRPPSPLAAPPGH